MLAIYKDLKDKKVLVTGANRGIGKSIVLALAEQQSHIFLNYRTHNQDVESLMKELEAMGAKVTPAIFDVNDTEVMKDVLTNIIKEHGPIEGLVNNAGISRDSLILRVKEKDVTDILNTNLKSVIMLSAFLSKNFLRAENVSVVNMSSVVGLMGNTSQAVYAATKAGVIGLTKSFAKEFASRNIRCNAIAPGFIETEMTSAINEKAKASYLETIPLKKYGTVEDVTNATCFLLSQASGYITGEVIKIDGGLYI
jgi:3-oxoacyl-[acyl-carrier protein] reductase